MVVYYRVHARVLKTSTRENVIPGLVECIRSKAVFASMCSFTHELLCVPLLMSYHVFFYSRIKTPTHDLYIPILIILRRSAEGGGDVTRVKSDLLSHLALLIDSYYLRFSGLV